MLTERIKGISRTGGVILAGRTEQRRDERPVKLYQRYRNLIEKIPTAHRSVMLPGKNRIIIIAPRHASADAFTFLRDASSTLSFHF